MENRIKIINRRIAKSEKCRCKYGIPITFDILQVNINYNGTITSYQIEAEKLSLQKDSIYFYPSIANGKLNIKWNKEVEEYIRKL